jgi:hypothetical protein
MPEIFQDRGMFLMNWNEYRNETREIKTQRGKHKCDAWLWEEQMNKRRQEGKASRINATWLLEQGVNKGVYTV